MKNYQEKSSDIEDISSHSSEESQLEIPQTQSRKITFGQQVVQKETSKSVSELPAIDLFSSFDIKCKCGHNVFFYCSSEGCYSNSFICNDENSPCFSRHSKCFNSVIAKNFYQKLNSKVVNDRENMDKMEEEIQKIIDKITDTVSDLNDKLKEKFKTFGLTDSELNLIQKIKKKCTSQEPSPTKKLNLFSESPEVPTGSNFSYFNNNLKNAQLNWFDDSVRNLHSLVRSAKQTVEGYFDDVQNILVSIHAKYDRYRNFQKNFALSKLFAPIDLNNKSKNVAQLKNLQKMLEQNNVNFDRITKVFSYSIEKDKNNVQIPFNTEKFYQSIESKSNLLFITTNVSGKSIGCYVPYEFKSQQKGPMKIQGDKLRQPFFFSLSNNISLSVDRIKFHIPKEQLRGSISFGEALSEGEIIKRFKLNINTFTSVINSVELILNRENIEEKPNGLFSTNQAAKSNIASDQVLYEQVNGFPSQQKSMTSVSKIKFLEVYELTIKSEDYVEKEANRLKQSASSNIFGQNNLFCTNDTTSKSNIFAFSDSSASSKMPSGGNIFGGNPFASSQSQNSQANNKTHSDQQNPFNKQPITNNPFEKKSKQ